MNVWVWIAWLVMVVALAATTRNPFYLGIVLACIVLLRWRMRPKTAGNMPEIHLFRLSLFIILFSACYNAAVSHFGEHVLFTLPESVPLLGGNITLEAFTYGLLNGLALSILFAAFALLNRVVPVQALINIVPRAFYPLALVSSIAITFIPVTLRQYRQIREAQAIRGHKMKGPRDWLGLLLPLLVGGLEKALQLAEAMTARGFAHTNGGVSNRLRGGLILGLAGMVTGWLWYALGKTPLPGFLVFLAGTAGIIFILWSIGKTAKRSAYKENTWSRFDTAALAGCLFAGIFTLCRVFRLGGDSLIYSPYPRLTLPGFSPWVALSLLGLLAPWLRLRFEKQQSREEA